MVEGIFYAKAAAFLGAAIAIGLGTIGPALGMGLVGSKGCESMGKYPEVMGQIRAATILGLIFIEALAIYALMIGFTLIGAGKSLV